MIPMAVQSARALAKLEFPLNPFSLVVALSFLSQLLNTLRKIMNDLEQVLGKLLLFTSFVSVIISHVWPLNL